MEIKGLGVGIHHRLTSLIPHPSGVCMAALLAFGLSGPVQGEGLEALVGALLGAVQVDGSLDLTGFACVQTLKSDETIHDCRDPVSGLGFLHLRDEGGDAIGVDIRKGASGFSGKGILVPDRAAFDRLEAEFGALAQSSLIQSLTRCALLGSDESTALAVKAEPSGLPVIMFFGRLDDASAAELQEPGNEGAILSAWGLTVQTDLDCQPYQP